MTNQRNPQTWKRESRPNPNIFTELYHRRKLIRLSLRPRLLRRDKRDQNKPSRIKKLLQMKNSQQRRILYRMKLRNKRKQMQKIIAINRAQRRKINKQKSSRPSWKSKRSRKKRQYKRSVSVYGKNLKSLSKPLSSKMATKKHTKGANLK